MDYNAADVAFFYRKYGISKTSSFFGKSNSWVRYFLTKNGYALYSRGARPNYINENYFENINSFAKAYFLGLLASDGCVSLKSNSVHISLKKEDRYLLELFRKELNAKNKVKLYVYPMLQFSSKKIKNDLSKFGIVPRKTKYLFWPILEEDMYPHYIRGYIDGDGCWFIRKRENTKDTLGLQITGASYSFLYNLQKFFNRTLDIKTKTIYKLKDKSCYELKYCGNNLTEKISNFVYPINMDKFFLERKYKIVKLHKQKQKTTKEKTKN